MISSGFRRLGSVGTWGVSMYAVRGRLTSGRARIDRRNVITCASVFFFQAEDGIRDLTVTGVQTCALPISALRRFADRRSRSLRLTVGDTGEVYPVSYYSLTRQFGKKRKQEISGSFVTVRKIGRASCRERV